MKKLLLILSMMVLMATMVFAVIPPTITELTENPYETYEAGCPVYVQGQNAIYDFCKSTGYDDVHLYNITTDEWSILATNINPSQGSLLKCEVYNDEIYCLKSGSINPNYLYFYHWNYATNQFDTLTTFDYTEGFGYLSCDLRPTTDEIWCHTYSYLGGLHSKIMKADISTETITEESAFSLSDEAYSCKFRNNDELWCGLGNNDEGGLVMKYVISTDTVTEIDTNYTYIYEYCRWYNDIFYCYGGIPDSNWVTLITDKIVYVDPSDNSFGLIDFPEWGTREVSMWDDSCINFDGGDWCDIAYQDDMNWYNTNQTLWLSWDGSGFPPVLCTPDWICTGYESCVSPLVNATCNSVFDNNACGEAYGGDYSEFTPQVCVYTNLEPYEPAHGIGDVTGLVVDFGVEMGVQYILFVGLIAVIGLGIWILKVM